jgi:hypothetical protein
MTLSQLAVLEGCGKPVEIPRLEVTSTPQDLLRYSSNGGSKRSVRRWFEHQDAKLLRELESPIFGLLIRLSHPRPRTAEQGDEFKRLVGLYVRNQIGRVA